MMAFALILNYAITSPVERLRAENGYFQKAAQKADALLVAANELTTMGLEGQFAAYKLSLDEHQKSVAALGKLEHLAAINPKMKSAVDAVAKLYVGSGAPFQRIMKGIENLLEDRTTLGMPVTNDPNFNSIAVRAYSSATDERTRNIAQFHIGNLMADLRKANDNLVFTASLIREKDAVVQAEIAKAIGGPSSTV
jgi:hypothetical protein